MTLLESSRTKLASLVLASGRLSISDSSFFFDSPLIVDLPPGTYTVEVTSGLIDGHPAIRALRVIVDDSASPTRGQLLGRVACSFSQIGLCDRDAAERAFQGLDEDGLNEFSDQFSISGLTGLASFRDGTPMLLVKPGAGDLDPPVYEMLGDDRRVGVELDFLDYGHDSEEAESAR